MYFCKHCGSRYINDQAVVCVSCGAPKGAGLNFCQNCGSSVQPGAAVCLHCGAAVVAMPDPNAKSKICAGLLGIFLGAFGVHNFYLGYTKKAIIQLVLSIVGILTTCLIVGTFLVIGIQIWGIVEGIMILSGSIKTDGSGQLLKD